jgi:homoserine dehydrogenase
MKPDSIMRVTSVCVIAEYMHEIIKFAIVVVTADKNTIANNVAVLKISVFICFLDLISA